MMPRCERCHTEFFRSPADWRRTTCNDCYASRRPHFSKTTPSSAPDPLRLELAARLPGLLSLCHPDHNPDHAQALATEITAWLLSCRESNPR